MNNNRSNNNRRRGRGNRNQGGGGNQGNRIDSRARGNAPQMLEKYKKLAQDAQHNGDRVQAEYYLQFADHYFRVLADNRSRQDESRGPRQREDRDIEDSGEDADYDDRRPSRRARERDDSRDDNDRDEVRGDKAREDRDRNAGRERTRARDDSRESRPRPRDRDEDSRDSEDEAQYEPAENPFLRKTEDEPRPPRRGALKPRRSEAKASSPKGEIDAAVLPPSIGARETANDAEDEAPPAPRRRRRKPDEDGAVSAVG